MAHGEHKYRVAVEWTGNRGTGTSGYREYGRDHAIRGPIQPDLDTFATWFLAIVWGVVFIGILAAGLSVAFSEDDATVSVNPLEPAKKD